ncbi:MAG: replicative DNA helicase [Candidatus Nanopelagicales bacterium]|nr:replicative DNA helicase [Candidatus Nanopelagicales bacterium]
MGRGNRAAPRQPSWRLVSVSDPPDRKGETEEVRSGKVSVTVAEFADRADPVTGPARTPPQDLAAERSVLGAMLLSKDAIADVVETIRIDDFYAPAHQTIYGAVTDLFGRGEPADAVTVSDSLTRAGDLSRVGGAAFLHTLIAGVPTAANAAYYAQIVRDRAILRRLVSAATRIVQWGYAGEGDVDQIVDQAQAEVFDVTARRASEDYVSLAEIMDGAVAEIEGIASRSGDMVGVPTGFADLDRLTNGLHPGQLVIVAARPAIGKALALNTPIPTPAGWTDMGSIRVGDEVLGADGHPTPVNAATPVMFGHDCYLVEFCDGSRIVADADHQWETSSPTGTGLAADSSLPKIITTTAQIARKYDRDLPHGPCAIANTKPLELPYRHLPIPPYTYGVQLALAGGSEPIRLAEDQAEIAMRLEAEGTSMAAVARGPSGGPAAPSHVGGEYLRASQGQRRDLLAGIADSLGVITPTGAVVMRVTSRSLAQGIYELLMGLGMRADVRGEPSRTLGGAAATALIIETQEVVFGCDELRLLHKELAAGSGSNGDQRLITAVTKIPSVPVRCMEVGNSDHQYLAGRSMVPTHNSTLGLDIARSASIKHGLPSAIFSLEMSRNEIVMRLLSAEAQIPLHHMRSGRMGDAEWRKIAARQGVLHEAPLYVDDSPNMTMTEIRAKCRRLRQRHDLRLVVLDYMQLMSSGRKVESRQQEVSEFSRSLKLLAKELDVPIIAISQLNRGPESRNDKKPMLSDLRESGCLTAETRVIRADTGVEVTMGELHAGGAREVPVWSLDDSLRYRARTLTHVFPTGTREVFRVRTASGRVVNATGNHPLLTHEGWRAVRELGPGARVAVPRRLPDPIESKSMDRFEITLLAHILGAGTLLGRRWLSCVSRDLDSVTAVRKAAYSRFGIETLSKREDDSQSWTTIFPTPPGIGGWLRNPITEWLRDLGVRGLEGVEPRVPAGVFGAPTEQVALFLRHLWAACGDIRPPSDGHQGSIHVSTGARRFADDVARLLLRLGLTAHVGEVANGESALFRVSVVGSLEQRVFLDAVGGFGPCAEAAKAWALLDRSAEGGDDAAPPGMWEDVQRVMAGGPEDSHAGSATSASGDVSQDVPSAGGRLAGVAEVLGNSGLDLVATNDVTWDEIVSVESIGQREVFDATVLGTHNFIADGMAVHNSLEQDADVVVLIHREDAYDKDSSRIGEADFIVAKHRNGPTDTITVAFQGHYSRFVDMAAD